MKKTSSDFALRPRFRFELNHTKEALLKSFKTNLSAQSCELCGMVSKHHVVINVPKDEEHFWSPQLSIDVEEGKDGKAIVRGLFAPKPQVWTMFMFFHFAIAAAFFIALVMLYVNWQLEEDYTLLLYAVIALPFLSIFLFLAGQYGKKKGHNQMLDLYKFLIENIAG